MREDLIERLHAYIAQREKIRDGGDTVTECNGVPLTLTDLRQATADIEWLRHERSLARDKLAAAAMLVFLRNALDNEITFDGFDSFDEMISEQAYALADAMMAKRSTS